MANESDDRNWYKAEAGVEVHSKVVGLFRSLDTAQADRKARNLENMKASGLRVVGLGPSQYAKRTENNQPRYNCIEAAIDALVSHIGSNKPSPYFLTDGDVYGAERQAELCTKAVTGQFYAAGTYTEGRKALADSLRMDGGVLKSYICDKEVIDRAVFPNDYLVDDEDAYHGKPRGHYEIEYCDRDALIEDHPEHEAAIKAAGLIRDDSWGGTKATSDPVAVVHAYWLPRKEGKKGKYAKVTDNATLVYEDWEELWSPYTVHVWMEQTQGVWGKGLAEQAGGAQRRLDANMRKIAILTSLGTVKLYIDKLANINHASINNDDLG